jgi:hypothetical protein
MTGLVVQASASATRPQRTGHSERKINAARRFRKQQRRAREKDVNMAGGTDWVTGVVVGSRWRQAGDDDE